MDVNTDQIRVALAGYDELDTHTDWVDTLENIHEGDVFITDRLEEGGEVVYVVNIEMDPSHEPSEWTVALAFPDRDGATKTRRWGSTYTEMNEWYRLPPAFIDGPVECPECGRVMDEHEWYNDPEGVYTECPYDHKRCHYDALAERGHLVPLYGPSARAARNTAR